MNKLGVLVFSSLVSAALVVSAPPAHSQDKWLPITPEDLAMKDNPAVPGSKAMILYRSIERNDDMGSQHEYVRIKVFTDEGKEFADVNILPFDREGRITALSGRTIHPDGSIVPFSGQVFDKIVERGRDYKISVKAFTLPDVTPGSIIEYKFTRIWEAFNPSTRDYYYFPRSQWEISGPLYQRAAHFEFKPERPDLFSYRMQGVHLPEYAKLNRDQMRNTLLLDLHDIPQYEEEPFMPPKLEAQMRVLFFYSPDLRIPEGDEYWKQNGKKWYGSVESFIDKKNALANAVSHTTSPSDSPDAKLHKLYDLVQSFDNLTFQRVRSEKETKALNIREIKNVEDVLNTKSGYRNELNRTFVALARSAGFEATLVKVVERDEAMLHKEWPAFSQLSFEIAMVKLNGNTVYLDPGSLYCPFGVLPWEDTGVQGLVFEKNMPTWITTPIPEFTDALIKRTAKLSLADDGTLSGEVVISFSGEDAYHRRMWARNDDDAARKKSMEHLLEEWLPVKGDIELVEVNDWKNSNLPLVVKYKVSLPGYASQAGHHVMIPSSLFAGAYRSPFTASKRMTPIVMENQYEREEDVTIALPKSFQVESLPKPVNDKNGVAELSVLASNEGGNLHFTRDFKMKGLVIEQKYYAALKNYFQTVQAGANEQAVLKMGN